MGREFQFPSHAFYNVPLGYYSVLSSFGASPFSFTEKSVIPDCTKILYHEINLLISVG